MNIPEIEANGIKLYYESRGEGKPMYVLHGGPGLDHRYFGHSFRELESIRQLYYIDFRGHGKSSKTSKKTYRLDIFADDIEALRTALGHDNIEIMGHSMGGSVALLYALNYPENLDSMILVGAAPRFTNLEGHYDMKARLMYLNLKNSLAHRLNKTVDDEAFAREVLLKSWSLYVPERLHPEYTDYIRSLRGLGIFYDMQQEMRWFNVTAELENINHPTLVIFGEDDMFIKGGRALKAIPDSRFSVIPATKHMPFLEDGKYFNMIVREFLTGKIL